MPWPKGMKVLTNTRRVREARRTVVELLLSEHNGECQTCDRNEDCELQALAAELGIREIAYAGEKTRERIDASTPALMRDNGKCIKCRRCVSVCDETQHVGALFPQNRGFETVIGPAFNRDLDTVACVQCGQCAAVCPVGAITEKDQIDEVWKALDEPDKHVVVQTAPAIRAALGECFGYPPGTLVTGKMVAALRPLGFDAVFDTNFAADLTIMEEGTELLTRLQERAGRRRGRRPADVHQLLAGLDQVHGVLPPRHAAEPLDLQVAAADVRRGGQDLLRREAGKRPEEIFVVSIMPCTAKKFECQRPEMDASGVRDVDVVLTTRELGKMIRAAGIDFAEPARRRDGRPAGPLHRRGRHLRQHRRRDGGGPADRLRNRHRPRTAHGQSARRRRSPGWTGVKEASLTVEDALPEWKFLEGVTLNVAVAHGLGNAREASLS